MSFKYGPRHVGSSNSSATPLEFPLRLPLEVAADGRFEAMVDSKDSGSREARIAAMLQQLPEITAILELYRKNEEGAAGADEKVMKILFQKWYARREQTPR